MDDDEDSLPEGKHCKTCKCGVKLKRHTCRKCKTKKLEKFLINVDGPRKPGWGKGGGHWECKDYPCAANVNYR